MDPSKNEGILLVDKPTGISSFGLIPPLRKRFNIKKIGHAGTLDPFASGLMILLIGRNYTKLATSFLTHDKRYTTTIQLGSITPTFDSESPAQFVSDRVPSLPEIEAVISTFQGKTLQTPPMFSAKKIKGERLYDLARRGEEVERAPVEVTLDITILTYNYPYLELDVRCSKGTYIRSLAYDIGQKLGVGAFACALRRTASGPFSIEDSIAYNFARDPYSEVRLLTYENSSISR